MKTRMTVMTVLVAAAVIAAPLGTEFTYQGVLTDAGTPASGDFDFLFLLYDADIGGSQVGSIVYVEDLTVTDGRMTTQLDFGSVFDGTALWLDVAVRDGGSTGGYAVLSPRQELTAAPFAQHAAVADTSATADYATTAGDAGTLVGESGSYYLTWSNFVGIPGDLADGDDDTLGDLSCSSAAIARWNGSAWTCSYDDDTPFRRTYVVGPVDTPIQNGLQLRSAINGITPPTNEEEAVLLIVEPGVYDVGIFALPIWGWMTIEGAGEDLTLIKGSECDSVRGTVIESAVLANHYSLRRLSVEHDCDSSSAWSYALHLQGDHVSVENVRASVIGSSESNMAVRAIGSDLRMVHLNLMAENGSMQNVGLSTDGDNAYLSHVTAEAIGGDGSAAMGATGNGLLLENSTLKASGSTSASRALNFQGCVDCTVQHVVADAGLGTDFSIGLTIGDSSVTFNDIHAVGSIGIQMNTLSTTRIVRMRNVEVEGFAEGVYCYANTAVLTLDVDNSWIRGNGNYGVINVLPTPGCEITVRGSYLMGTPGGVSGDATCIAVWDDGGFHEDYCP